MSVIFGVDCDEKWCGNRSVVITSRDERDAVEAAKREGWTHVTRSQSFRHGDFCPRHKEAAQ